MITACGSSSGGGKSSSSTASSAAPSLTVALGKPGTGLGASTAEFAAAHPKNAGFCAEGCYGPAVQIAPGKTEAQFHAVKTVADRIVRYEQALGSDVSPDIAEKAALAVLPRDTEVIRSEVSHSGGDCKVLLVRSPTLGRWFANPSIADRAGLAEVSLHGVDPASGRPTYPAHLSEASVGLSSGTPGC